MNMNRFSILLTLACIGIALMLAGNASAQDDTSDKISFESETSIKAVEERPYKVGESAPLTITLRRNGIAVPGEQIDFEVLGMVDSRNIVVERDPNAATVNPSSGITNRTGRDIGKFSTSVTFNKAPPVGTKIGIKVTAPNFIDAYSIIAYEVGDAPLVTLIVATPKVDGPLAVGDTFTYSIEIEYVRNLASWQMDLTYNPTVLEAIAVSEGDFLTSGDINAAFQPGDMSPGRITGIWQARVGRTVNEAGENVLTEPVAGVNGSGELLSIEFRVREFAEEALGLSNVQLSTPAYVSSEFAGKGAGDSENPKPHRVPEQILVHDRTKPTQDRISYQIRSNPVVVTHQYPRVDVNRDKVVDILDLVEIAASIGRVPANPRADVNGDGIVNTLDLTLVAGHSQWGEAVEPVEVRKPNDPAANAPLSASVGQQADLTPETIRAWIDLAQVEDDGSAIFDLGIANLERLLHATVPEATKLLLNYPNPFNPETWIPYQLAKATDVSVSIYSVNGALVRTLALGHQAAGVYQSKSQAAYWDGRNEFGEQVASGVYFYTLTAGDFSATGKMLVRK